MGIIAESFVNYAQPLIDDTDGSEDQMQRAMNVAQMCWNLALMPENEREAAIEKFKSPLELTDEEFAEFRQKFILPMIERHIKMFPGLHGRDKQARLATAFGSPQDRMPLVERLFDDFGAAAPPPPKKRMATGPYEPCPCGSGRKYKWCCGARK
jgi:hypothetical protein